MASFFDISAWNEKKFLNTGGTREKCIVENPQNSDLYYFKTSLKKEVIDYKYEFWSEIIASEVGRGLGFPILEYNIACKAGKLGCLSKSMNAEDYQELREGIRFLTGYDNSYFPESKESYNRYTFNFIHEALKKYGLGRFIEDIIRIIIFDSIIGNGDRHQENWGFLIPVKQIEVSGEKRKTFLSQLKGLLPKSSALDFDVEALEQSPTFNIRIENMTNALFAPIYDSGSCLGREIDEAQMIQMLKDDQRLDAYVRNGKAEIRWEGPKMKHFELIQKLREEYGEFIEKEINRIIRVFDEQLVRQIVSNIDNQLPGYLSENKVPDIRKEFIIKIIILRFEKLKEVLR